MAFLPYPVHTSITSPRVSVLSHMWLIFLFWWSSYFEEVTIKQVNTSSTSIYFLQSISAVISRQTIHRTDQRWQERVGINEDGEQKEILANSIVSGDRGQGGNLNGVLLGNHIPLQCVLSLCSVYFTLVLRVHSIQVGKSGTLGSVHYTGKSQVACLALLIDNPGNRDVHFFEFDFGNESVAWDRSA